MSERAANWYVIQDACGNYYKGYAYSAEDLLVQCTLKVPWVIKMVRPFETEDDEKLKNITELTYK